MVTLLSKIKDYRAPKDITLKLYICNGLVYIPKWMGGVSIDYNILTKSIEFRLITNLKCRTYKKNKYFPIEIIKFFDNCSKIIHLDFKYIHTNLYIATYKKEAPED